jgi:hypothetical protein
MAGATVPDLLHRLPKRLQICLRCLLGIGLASYGLLSIGLMSIPLTERLLTTDQLRRLLATPS